MIPVNEGNEDCQRCEYFYHAYGCMPTYSDVPPPCGRAYTKKDHGGEVEMCPEILTAVMDHEFEEHDRKHAFNEFLSRLPMVPTVLRYTGKRNVYFWFDGVEILCDCEITTDILADMIRVVYGIDAHTGFYDPADDAREDCVDSHTGYYYIDFD